MQTWREVRGVVAEASDTINPAASFSHASLFVKCWNCSRMKAHSTFSSHFAPLALGLIVSTVEGFGAGGAGGGGVPEKHGPGRPKESRKKMAAASGPSSAPRRGQPPGIKNKTTSAAFAATASGSIRPSVAASLQAGPLRLQPMLPALQPPTYATAEG
jgi:hypothetical protein